jgi:multiubiquitin
VSNPEVAQGPKYTLDIEGRDFPWDHETITTEDLIRLGGWESNQGVIEIDKDNNERTLKPGEVIELKPGQGFAKKVKFKRG